MEDNKTLETKEEVVAVEETAPAPNKKQKVKEEPKIEEVKEEKVIHEIVLAFNDYKNRLAAYEEVDGRIICGKFLDIDKAKSEAKKFLEKGILVEIKSK